LIKKSFLFPRVWHGCLARVTKPV